ncbi:MAG TPA: hypothetical protein VLE95_00275 [Chlamydiales bacterium]|nr:hypothetical protein [Chlamydiales bacterium]
MSKWLDVIFPPICKSCKEPCNTRLFCLPCWEECALPDPALRCRHCFEEEEDEICPQCRNKPQLAFPSAFVFETSSPALYLCQAAIEECPEVLASFAFVQWERLGWPIPDVVIPCPGSLLVAKPFACLLNRPCFNVLRSWNGNWSCDTSVLNEDRCFLLFSMENSMDDLASGIDALIQAFPKKIFVLTLMPFIETEK